MTPQPLPNLSPKRLLINPPRDGVSVVKYMTKIIKIKVTI
jgi:hypothetical protein